MSIILATPDNIHIKPRRVHIEFKHLDKNFINNNPVLTALCCALSAVFPPGEAQFIQSVRHYREQIKDAALKKRVRAFIGQEAHHSHEHDSFNQYLQQLGWRTDIIERQSLFLDRHLGKLATPAQKLAQTAALEHLTAIFADYALENPDNIFSDTDTAVRKLFLWHAIEEIEHKAVAFDVFQSVVGDNQLRVNEMRKIAPFFALHMLESTIYLLFKNRQLLDFKAWRKAYFQLFNKQNGMFPTISQQFKNYRDENFHPWQYDNSSLTKKWLRKLDLND